MNVNKELKQFIEENIETIESQNADSWIRLYEKFEDWDGDSLPGEFGRLMLDLDVDPAEIMREVPRRFLQFQHDTTSYKIPENCGYIGMSAFEDTGLEHIYIPPHVSGIDFLAFAGTNIDRVILPTSVTLLENAVFHSCKKLTEADLRHVKHLGEDIFGDCIHLKNVVLPSDPSVTIDASNFDGCTRLKEMKYLGTMDQFKACAHRIPLQDITIHCSDGDYIWSLRFEDEDY